MLIAAIIAHQYMKHLCIMYCTRTEQPDKVPNIVKIFQQQIPAFKISNPDQMFGGIHFLCCNLLYIVLQIYGLQHWVRAVLFFNFF